MKIRIATLDDALSIQKIYAYYVVNTDISFEYDVPSVDEMKERIKVTDPYLVAEIDNQVVGYAYASQFRSRIGYQYSYELSVYIDKDYHRQGIAKELYIKLFEILKVMNIQTLYACITYPNQKSEEFHKRFGFKKVGHLHRCGYKFNEWLDVIYMEKYLLDYHKITEIIPFCDISDALITEILYSNDKDYGMIDKKG
ncbi:MAG: N-acetyltransferase family protein [Coprobacillus sp.]